VTEDDTNTQAQQQPPRPTPLLRNLDRVVGTWNICGPDIHGPVTFGWMEGGFILMQHGELECLGHKMKVIEYIGYELKWGAEEARR
jgi:hypothetical protein